FLGFYPGERYNFLLFYSSNPQDGNHEVIRVVKYDKNWNRLGSGGEIASTTIGVGNGTGAPYLDCAEYNGYLYVHIGRLMDIGHQACATLVFRENDMKETDTTSPAIRAFDADYVSHAYEQQILVDKEGRLVSLDLGDAAPHRAVVLHRYPGKVHGTLPSASAVNYHVQDIAGTYEQYGLATGCTVAGMVEAGDYYLVVYQYDPTISSGRGENGDLFYQFVDKETLTGKSVKLANGKVDGVKITPVDDSSGYIIWSDAQDEEKISYTTYGNGTVGNIQQAKGYRAGSTPILYQGKLVWSVDIIECQSEKGGFWQARTGQYYKRFYTLDPKTGAVTHKDFMMIDTEAASGKFTDVSANTYYADAVTWAVKNNITVGTGANTFSPDQNCTEIQILTFLWRAAGKPSVNVTLPVSVTGASDYVSAAKWAYSKGMIGASFKQDTPCTRAAAVKFMWQAAGTPTVSGGNFTDVPANADYAQAVAWAVAKGVTQGTGDNTFSPNNICSRAQIVTFLYRDRAN
ncbi:MAG: S-layer homology domain-containing protein, partial [Oscillospiraceae bacterium]|nr:S-layer homology domain-containing protein [Oscillospiraceae bacterium]